jgi:hypothetical protein
MHRCLQLATHGRETEVQLFRTFLCRFNLAKHQAGSRFGGGQAKQFHQVLEDGELMLAAFPHHEHGATAAAEHVEDSCPGLQGQDFD